MKYKIKKGKHYHSNLWARIIRFFVFGKRLQYEIMIPLEAWYERKNKDDDDWNKLYGFGQFDPTINSNRFVWRPIFSKKGWFMVGAMVTDDQDWEIYELFETYGGQYHKTALYWFKNAVEYIYPTGLKKYAHSSPNPHWKHCDPFNGGDNPAYRTYTLELNRYKY